MTQLLQAGQILVALQTRLKTGRAQGVSVEQLIEDADLSLQIIARFQIGPTSYDRWFRKQLIGYLLHNGGKSQQVFEN